MLGESTFQPYAINTFSHRGTSSRKSPRRSTEDSERMDNMSGFGRKSGRGGDTKGVQEPKKEVDILLESNRKILAGMAELGQKLDAMDKTNKKFLMATTMGKQDVLEKENLRLKKGSVTLFEQIELLLSAVYDKVDDGTRQGMETSYRQAFKTLEEMGLEVIQPQGGEAFNPEEQECIKSVVSDDVDGIIVAELVQNGYKDKATGHILKCAKVVVYQGSGKDGI